MVELSLTEKCILLHMVTANTFYGQYNIYKWNRIIFYHMHFMQAASKFNISDCWQQYVEQYSHIKSWTGTMLKIVRHMPQGFQ